MPTPAPTYGVTRLRPGKSTYALAKTFCDERLQIRSSARTLIERHSCVVRWLLVGVGCTCGVHRLGNRIDGIAQRLTASVE